MADEDDRANHNPYNKTKIYNNNTACMHDCQQQHPNNINHFHQRDYRIKQTEAVLQKEKKMDAQNPLL